MESHRTTPRCLAHRLPRAFRGHPAPCAELGRSLELAEAGRHIGQAGHAQAGWNLIEQRLDAWRTDCREHFADILLGVRNKGHDELSPAWPARHTRWRT